MICGTCAAAADSGAGADAHCASTGGPGGCPCQHRVERYRPPLPLDDGGEG